MISKMKKKGLCVLLGSLGLAREVQDSTSSLKLIRAHKDSPAFLRALHGYLELSPFHPDDQSNGD